MFPTQGWGWVSSSQAGGSALLFLAFFWDFDTHSPSLHSKPVGRGETPLSPTPGWPVPPHCLGEGQVAFRGGLQVPSPRPALSYRLLLLLSIFLEFSPSPTSLSCWLSLLLLKIWKKCSWSEL